MTLGKRLTLLRKERNLTQAQLADLTFISRSRLSLYEIDKREPDLHTLRQLAAFFRVSTDYLLGIESPAETAGDTDAAYEIYLKLQSAPPENRRAIEILLGLDKSCGKGAKAN